MSKGLEALENICNQCEHYQFEKGLRPKKCPFNKSCVFKQRIEKELKVLEIIKNHLVNREDDTSGVYIEMRRGYYEPYYEIKLKDGYKILLTQEEYELLKEVLL